MNRNCATLSSLYIFWRMWYVYAVKYAAVALLTASLIVCCSTRQIWSLVSVSLQLGDRLQQFLAVHWVKSLYYVLWRTKAMTSTRSQNIKWPLDSITVHCCIWKQLMHHRRTLLQQFWGKARRRLCPRSWGMMWIGCMPTANQTSLVNSATFTVTFPVFFTVCCARNLVDI